TSSRRRGRARDASPRRPRRRHHDRAIDRDGTSCRSHRPRAAWWHAEVITSATGPPWAPARYRRLNVARDGFGTSPALGGAKASGNPELTTTSSASVADPSPRTATTARSAGPSRRLSVPVSTNRIAPLLSIETILRFGLFVPRKAPFGFRGSG